MATTERTYTYTMRSWDPQDTDEKTATYRVGQAVEVWAYGRWRTGHVLATLPKRIRVRFNQNMSGKQGERVFYPHDVKDLQLR